MTRNPFLIFLFVQCKYTRNILPEDDDRRTLAVIQKAIGAIESDNMDSAEKILNDFTAEEDLLVSEVVYSPFS